ncbi:MAG TPA: DNA-directed RNA polymerase [Thermoplasmata archaeon]|nr:DNA-directed RNA polymerase [Thermoplasmata archaeon]
MYRIEHKSDVVRIPPDRLGHDLNKACAEIARETFEGKVHGSSSLLVLVRNVHAAGAGKVVHGDGAVYQKVDYDALMFDVDNGEVVLGTVVEVMKFGAFVRFGPLDGLLHISQLMDDRINVDETNQRLLGKDSKRDLRIDDDVQSRIVSVSVNELAPRESRIGLTMRQVGLGKVAWLQEDRAPKDEKDKRKSKPAAGKGDKREEKK